MMICGKAARLMMCLLFLCAPIFGQKDPKEIVAQLFPQQFIDKMSRPGAKLKKVVCFAVYDSTPSGSAKTIIAGYSDNYGGTVQVIQRNSDGTYRVVYEPSGMDFGGMRCHVDLADLDGDGQNEIRVAFSSARGNTGDWIFKWDGSQLIPLNPTAQLPNDRVRTTLVSTDFVDIYHDGTLQILSMGGSVSPVDGSIDQPNYLYRLSSGKYVLDTPVLFLEEFPRKTGIPETKSSYFDQYPGSVGPYVLKISNGDQSGKNRVSSGHILVNGVEFVGPNEFNQQVGVFTVPLSGLIARLNHVEVQLEGKPGGQVTVVVEDHTPPAP
jgi:hypothetical protein